MDIYELLASKSQWELFLGALNMAVGGFFIFLVMSLPFYLFNKITKRDQQTKHSETE